MNGLREINLKRNCGDYMKKYLIIYPIIFCMIISINQTLLNSQIIKDNNSFDKELFQFRTNTAQVFGNDLAQIPNWSENSDILYCKNQSGDIYSINLNDAKLTGGVWHEDTIGIIRTDLIKQLTPEETEIYNSKYHIDKSTPYKDSIQTNSGCIIKFVHNGFSHSFIIQERNKQERVAWVSFSVCGVLIVSPNEKYVAFYCETSGVFIMKLN